MDVVKYFWDIGRDVNLHDCLLSNSKNLDLDVHSLELLCAHIDLHESGIHRFIELTEPGDETNLTYGWE
jgi:hypothetical protein